MQSICFLCCIGALYIKSSWGFPLATEFLLSTWACLYKSQWRYIYFLSGILSAWDMFCLFVVYFLPHVICFPFCPPLMSIHVYFWSLIWIVQLCYITYISDKNVFGFSSQLDGRVKTLHPNIHGGILARRDKKHHIEALNTHGIGKFIPYRSSQVHNARNSFFEFGVFCLFSLWELGIFVAVT